jgi:hypothetical protein
VTNDTLSASITINAPAQDIFAVLADPARHTSIDGTGWVEKSLDPGELTAAGQTFRMTMYHPSHPDGNYEITNQVQVLDRPRAISWKPGYVEDGVLKFGGWLWRYDLAEEGPAQGSPAQGSPAQGSPAQTRVTLTYDWSGAPDPVRQRIGFPPFPPSHLENSLAHLAGLVAA